MLLAQKIVQIRKTRGYSQEELSNKANISLRTLQRIEKGESEPRGHTLRAIAEVLEVPVEELMDFTKKEDKGFLQLMSLSALSYWFMPLLNILVPMALWLFRRDKIQGVERLGKQIISFQILWSVLTYGIPIAFFFLRPVVGFEASSDYFFSVTILIPAIGYTINTIFILLSVFRVRKEKRWVYFFPLKFV